MLHRLLTENIDRQLVVYQTGRGSCVDVSAPWCRGRVLRARVLRRRLLRWRRRPAHHDAVGRVRTHEGGQVRSPRVRVDRLPCRRAFDRQLTVLRAQAMSLPRVDVTQRQTVPNWTRLLPRGQLRLCPWFVSHSSLRPHTRNSTTVRVKEILPEVLSQVFPKRLGICRKNFICLLCVPNYAILRIFIQLSPTVTKLCHIKCDHPACVLVDGGHFEHIMVIALNMA